MERERWDWEGLLHARYRTDEPIPAADALPLKDPAPAAMAGGAAGGATPQKEVPAFVEQDSLLVIGGVRLNVRNEAFEPDWSASFTAAYLKLRQDRRGSDEADRYALSFEKRLRNTDTWITLSAGREFGQDEGKDDTFVLGGVKIGFDAKDFGGKR